MHPFAEFQQGLLRLPATPSKPFQPYDARGCSRRGGRSRLWRWFHVWWSSLTGLIVFFCANLRCPNLSSTADSLVDVNGSSIAASQYRGTCKIRFFRLASTLQTRIFPLLSFVDLACLQRVCLRHVWWLFPMASSFECIFSKS